MKYIFLAIAFSGFLFGCVAQKTITPKATKMYTPIVDKKFEKFDFVRYNNRKDTNSMALREFLNNGNYVEMLWGKSGASYTETPKDSFFMITKVYYTNGNIKTKGLTFNVPWGGSFQKGIWYEFDKKGKLTKETDYDKNYEFTFDMVLAFCKQNGIRVDKGPILQSTGFHTLIRRGRNFILDNDSWWEIEWLKQPDLIEIIKLNGTTGAVMGRQNKNYINN